MPRRAFTLVEVLVVLGITTILLAILVPVTRTARQVAERTACASNLRQIGTAMQAYLNDNDGCLPMVVEPVWKTDGSLDFTADPFDFEKNPRSLAAVLQSYLSGDAIFSCRSAKVGYPEKSMLMSYRVSSANNFDGQIRTEKQLLAGTNPQYAYNLKYLNGRKYRLRYVDANTFPFRVVSGVGPFYLLRDFVSRDSEGHFHAPHRDNFNQLKLDLSVSFEKETNVGFSYP